MFPIFLTPIPMPAICTPHSALCYLPWASPHHHFQVEAILHLLPSILVPPALPAPSPRFAQSAEQNGERAGERCLVSSFIIHPSTFIICPQFVIRHFRFIECW